jgi:succinate dehydrogenase / fumarate reductase membrane anchor subunit
MTHGSAGPRSALGRARGAGPAKDGVAHWWAQRLTALALVPLTVWFVASVVLLASSDYERFTAWLGAPLPAILMILLIVATFHHAQLGLQVVIEDYVHNRALRLTGIVIVKFAAILLGLGSVFAVLRIALGG